MRRIMRFVAAALLAILVMSYAKASDPLGDRDYAAKRFQQLTQTHLSQGERDRFQRAFYGLGLSYRERSGSTACSNPILMGKTSHLLTQDKRSDGSRIAGAFLDLCLENMYWAARTTLLWLVLDGVLSTEEQVKRGESLFQGYMQYQRTFSNNLMFTGNSGVPACHVIWVAYFLARYGSVADCRGPGRQENFDDAAGWLLRQIKLNMGRKGLVTELPASSMQFTEYLDELGSRLSVMVFDRVALHEVGHVLAGHHMMAAPQSREESEERERIADAVAARIVGKDDLESFLAYFVNLGIALHVRTQIGDSPLENRRQNDMHLACESLKVVRSSIGSANDSAYSRQLEGLGCR